MAIPCCALRHSRLAFSILQHPVAGHCRILTTAMSRDAAPSLGRGDAMRCDVAGVRTMSTSGIVMRSNLIDAAVGTWASPTHGTRFERACYQTCCRSLETVDNEGISVGTSPRPAGGLASRRI